MGSQGVKPATAPAPAQRSGYFVNAPSRSRPSPGSQPTSLPAFQRVIHCISGGEEPGQGVFLEAEPLEGSGRAGESRRGALEGPVASGPGCAACRSASRKGEKPMRQRPRGSRSRCQCGAAGASRPHVLRARGSRSACARYLAAGPTPARARTRRWAQAGGGRGKNPKLEKSLADRGPPREGGHRGLKGRRAGKSREDTPRKPRELRDRVEQPHTRKPCPPRVSVMRPLSAPRHPLCAAGCASPMGCGRPGKQALGSCHPGLLDCTRMRPGQVAFSRPESRPPPSPGGDWSHGALRSHVVN